MSSFFGAVVMLANFALSPALLLLALLLAFFGFNKDGLLGLLGSQDPGSCCANPLNDALCISKFVAVKSESLAFFLMVSSQTTRAAVRPSATGISASFSSSKGGTNWGARIIIAPSPSMSFFSFLSDKVASSDFPDPFVPVTTVVVVSSASIVGRVPSIAVDDGGRVPRRCCC